MWSHRKIIDNRITESTKKMEILDWYFITGKWLFRDWLTYPRSKTGKK